MATVIASQRTLIFSMLFFTMLFAGASVFAIWIFYTSVLPIFHGEHILMWGKFGPLALLTPLALSPLWLKCIIVPFRKRDPDDPTYHLRPVFKYDEHIMIAIAFLAIPLPFIIQPIIDYIVMPSLGYEYCEALTYRSSFGFQTYAYVDDPALCG